MSSAKSEKIKLKIAGKWQSQTIESKMKILAILVAVIVLVSVILDLWAMKLTLFDFRSSLSANEKVGSVVTAYENESKGLKDFAKGRMSIEDFMKLSNITDEAVEELPVEYGKMGAERVAWSQKIEKAHSVYRKKCTEFVGRGEDNPDYVKTEYSLYEMLDYLKGYSSTLLTLTTVSVNEYYQHRYRGLIIFPIVILLIASVLMVAVTHTSKVMDKTIIEPIVKLVNAARRIENNDIFIEDVVVNNKDEIGDLVHAFNKMKYATGVYINTLEENRIALDKLHEEELKKKDAENQLERMKFDVLRHQINPHFLFNTLNVISGMASLEDAKTTEKMIKSLSSLFRYNLRTTEKENALEQEISVINDYMYLQGMRFGNRIQYEVDIDSSLMGIYIPSFSLQPIVENCIVHGLASKEEGGLIRIEAKEENDYIYITISDTGVGMDEEELARLWDKINDKDELRTAIGVGNIYRRLLLMHPDAVFEIQSSKESGTKTIIGIPLSRGKGNVNV